MPNLTALVIFSSGRVCNRVGNTAESDIKQEWLQLETPAINLQDESLNDNM